jgi:O-antigen/teichoic acid export membrane protein
MFKNGVYNLIGSILKLLIGVVTVPLLIRFLGLEDYGLWTLVSSTLVLVGLAEGGMASSTIFFVSKDLGASDEVSLKSTLYVFVSSMVLLATVMAILLVVSAPGVLKVFSHLSEHQRSLFVPALQWGALAVWGRMLQGVFVGIALSYGKYGSSNIISTGQVLVSNIGLILLAWSGSNMVALMQWQVLSGLIILIFHTGLALKLINQTSSIGFRFFWDWHKFTRIAKYSGSVWLTSIGNALFSQCDKIVVGFLLEPQLLGVYAAITGIASQINTLSGTVVQPLLSEVSNRPLGINENQELLLSKINQAIKLNIAFSYGFGGLMLGLSPMIIRIIFPQGSDIASYLNAFEILVVIYSTYSANSFAYFILLGLNKESLQMKIVLTCSIISLFMIYCGTYFLGLLGAVIGNSGFLGIFAMTFSVFKLLNVKLSLFFKSIWLDLCVFIGSSVILILMPVDTMIVHRILLMTVQVLWMVYIIAGEKIIWLSQKYSR